MGKEIQILLVDDHAIVRQGLRALLNAEADFKVVDEAENGLEALEKLKEINPDVAIIDLMMPKMNGLEVARQLTKLSLRTKVIILSMYDDEGFVLEALENGASGYVLKDSDSRDLAYAVREVLADRPYLSPALSSRSILAYQQSVKTENFDKYDTLTTLERKVLQLSVDGLTVSDIASKLGISPHTFETHRTNLMSKLDIHSQADLIRYAIKRETIPLDK